MIGCAQEDAGCFKETVVFLGYFEDLPDGREVGKVRYPLNEVLLLCLLAVLSGAETFTDIANFGHRNVTFLRRFRPFASGAPSHDHLGDILATLDAEAFQRYFVAWVASLTGVATAVIAIELSPACPGAGRGQDGMQIQGRQSSHPHGLGLARQQRLPPLQTQNRGLG